MKKYRDGGDISINGIIKILVNKHELYKVRELWEEFFKELDQNDLDPKIIPHANPKKHIWNMILIMRVLERKKLIRHLVMTYLILERKKVSKPQ